MTLFLETAAAGTEGGYGLSMLLMFVPLILIMYFMMIRPERKKQKKAEAMRNSLSVGDEITTIGGITGRIVQITEETVTFETGEDRVRIQVKKWAISTTAKMEAEEAAATKRR